MPTIQNRLHRYRLNLTKEQKMELGKIVLQTYQNSGINKPIFRRKSQEPEGVFTVCDYHPDFNEKLDEVIKLYCDHHKILPVRRRKKVERKPAFSARKNSQSKKPYIRKNG